MLNDGRRASNETFYFQNKGLARNFITKNEDKKEGDIDNESSTQIILKEKLAALVLLNDRGIEQSLIDNAMKPDKSHQRWTALLSLFGKETTILLKDKDNIENIDELYNVSSKK